jgi:L-asparaginase / beta-aspartyl-peptidase
MKKILFLSTFVLLITSCHQDQPGMPVPESANKKTTVAIVIHGGAGNLRKLNLTKEEELAYMQLMETALHTGYDLLKEGKSSIDAVEATIRIMEDSPLFNAGKGSVFSHDGVNEMDAAIMNGKDLSCGSITGVRTIRNPISTARLVMEKSEHVFLSGRGAEEFARLNGVAMEDPSYFYTEHRWQQLQEALKKDSIQLDHTPPSASLHDPEDFKFGTVGCVALDSEGNLAAGTSTGGLTNKKFGRIGDSPLIGCGTYAGNESCAVSCTGRGEDFIRNTVAADIAARCKYLNEPLDTAVRVVIEEKLKKAKGRGGCIALDTDANISAHFTTSGMYRGWIDQEGKLVVKIYEE